jgi:SAM-dependent methyltransferase
MRGGAAAPWVAVRGASYFRCPACGFVRLDDARVLSRDAEEARYRLHRNGLADAGYRTYLETFLDRAAAPYTSQGARILDFGSGPEPSLATLLRDRGYDVSIYDPHFAPARRPLRGPFDLIILHEVIEHLARPHTTLARLVRRLSPGGSLAIRTRFAPEEPAVFARWWYREDPTHRSFLARSTFAALAARLVAEVALLEDPDLAVLRPGVAAGGHP